MLEGIRKYVATGLVGSALALNTGCLDVAMFAFGQIAAHERSKREREVVERENERTRRELQELRNEIRRLGGSSPTHENKYEPQRTIPIENSLQVSTRRFRGSATNENPAWERKPHSELTFFCSSGKEWNDLNRNGIMEKGEIVSAERFRYGQTAWFHAAQLNSGDVEIRLHRIYFEGNNSMRENVYNHRESVKERGNFSHAVNLKGFKHGMYEAILTNNGEGSVKTEFKISQ